VQSITQTVPVVVRCIEALGLAASGHLHAVALLLDKYIQTDGQRCTASNTLFVSFDICRRAVDETGPKHPDADNAIAADQQLLAENE